ncbi:MAG: putative zinc-binding metallopeptidase [Egibacteraceae bacterium]
MVSSWDDPEHGLAFDLLPLSSQQEQVLTGHDAGVITIDLAESDDARRERVRQEMGEPYRTMLGHLRGDGEGVQPVEPVSMSCQIDHAAAQRVAVEGVPSDGGEGVEQRRERIDGAARCLALLHCHCLVHMFDYGMGKAAAQGHPQFNG